MTSSRILATVGLLLFPLFLSACGFAGHHTEFAYDVPGFFQGVWHGLLAPYTLVIRLFIDIEMYAMPNNGWLYDAGFLLGVAGSLPIGLLAVIIQILVAALA